MPNRLIMILAAVLLLVAGGFFWTVPVHAADPYTLLGWSEYGMHSIDSDYSIFSLSPPHNVIHAQLIDASGKLVKNSSQVTITYEAVADPSTGAINSTSDGKTSFWQYAATLLGFSGAANEGMKGANMPGSGNAAQTMAFDDKLNRFTANGIPITPVSDETLTKNYYPLMKLTAKDASGAVLATTRVTLPVSDEVSCRTCHASGTGVAKAQPEAGWANDENAERDFRLNILRKHDDHNAALDTFQKAAASVGYAPEGLFATASNGTPVLCAKCHSSNNPALNAPGIEGIPALTAAMHLKHSTQTDPASGQVLDDMTTRAACYNCHPGTNTKSLRGAMGHAVADDGSFAIQCQSCHGNMSAVADANRKGWQTLPNCQACHTGTATTALNGKLRNYTVFGSDGNMVKPSDTTFATNDNQPADGLSLFRASTGHGGLMCQACHGPTHAESPGNANDNLQSVALQGAAGAVQDCAICHKTGVSTNNLGPHGMHSLGQTWVTEHETFAARNRTLCQPCHGTDYRGTPLSRAFTSRSLSIGRAGTVSMFRGYQVSCYTCHNGPSGSGNPATSPAVNNTTASGVAGQEITIPVTVTLSATLRVVSQPAGGIAYVKGTSIVYKPFAEFKGQDKITYAAIASTGKDSNLGTATVEVTAAASEQN